MTGNLLKSQDIHFNHITPDQGFGFGNVWGILEDHEGFMWFATEDGLLRYDGYTLVTYRNDKSDPTSISANFSVVLLEDRFDQLWIGTFGGGLNLYDRNKDTFRRFINDPDNPGSLPYNRVKTLTESQDGNIWVGTEGKGMVTFDPNPENLDEITFKRFSHPQLDTSDTKILMIRSATEDQEGNFYFGSLGGLTIVDNSRENLIQLRAGDSYPNILSSNIIQEVSVDSKKHVWIGTQGTGLDLYLPKEKRVINYSPSQKDQTLNHPEIETFTEDQNGQLWVGTDDGLSRLKDNNSAIPENEFINYSHESLNEHSLLSNPVKCVYVDSRNSLWVGTYYGGINVYNSNLYKFTPIRHKPWIGTSLPHNNITAFAEDKQGNLWLGSDGGGISLLKDATEDILKDDYSTITISAAKDQEPEVKTKTMKFDHNGNLWIGFWVGGLIRYQPQNQETTYYGLGDASNSGLEGIRILDLEVDAKNNIWIGTFDQGISYLDQQSGKVKTYFPSEKPNTGVKGERFNALLIDTKQRVWAGGDLGGLNLYDESKDAFDRIEVDSILTGSISILSLLELSTGEICIGTVASGIIIYNPETKTIRNYSESSGLPNNVIHAMLEDGSGNIWMSTNMGLAVVDLHTDVIINYTKIEGLQGNQFNNGSNLHLSNGMMLFGGTNGWNAFYPDSIYKSNQAEKIVYTNFWVNGNLVHLKDENSVLTSHLNSAAPIELHHTQKSFSVEFAILDYDFSHVNQYAYLLEPFDDDWQYIGTDRKAVFTNLNPGIYRLRVKATNHDGFWVEKPNSLVIRIIPAWWQTGLFKIGAIVFVSLLLYLIYKIRISFLVNQRSKLEKIVQQRTGELKSKNLELHGKNDEIQAQNEELSAQNDQIIEQREELEKAQSKLKNINEQLEDLVQQRTAKLEKTIKQLDKTVMELDRFVYSASHDLSSPLKSIKGLIQIIEIEQEPDRVRTCIEHMIKSVNSLEDVIKSLVDYSRNAHLDVKKLPINCHELLKEVISELMYMPETDRIRFEDIPENSIKVESDSSRLKIILHNLIGNAIKYADLQKKESFIRFGCSQNDDYWEFSISDNGIGIEQNHLSKIFDMYYRASESSIGSGLGLFIVRESVSKLDGTIKVESTKGMGTTFTLKFPNN